MRIYARVLYVFLAAVSLYAQPGEVKEVKAPKNAVLTDLNPMLTALSYLQINVSGFGLELDYERVINDRFSAAADVKTVHLAMSDMQFSVWDLGLSGRYYPLENGNFFTNLRTGLSLYQSPYHKGWILNIGLDAGWKFIIKSRLVLEPYLGCHVSSDDKFIMPFTITSLPGLVVPGLTTGLRFGFCF